MILIVSAVFPPETVVSAKLSLDIAEVISKINEIIVLTPKPTRPLGFNFSNDLSLIKVDFKHIQTHSLTYPKSNLSGRIRESYSFGKHCARYINENNENIKLIYANTWPLLAQFMTVKAARKYNIPIIIHVQDIYPESITQKLPLLSSLLNFLLLPIDKYVLRKATKIIAISDKMRNYLVSTRAIEKDKVSVVQNWQDEETFIEYSASKKTTKSSNCAFTFMYLGNIGPVAGIELLIKAFAKADLKDCRLIIAGSGSMKESLQKMTTALNLKTIEFWTVPDGKVPEIQDHADVMLLPIKEGAAMSSIPSKLPAYMFSAKPIIACVDLNSDTANAIQSSHSGWVLPPENIDSLAEMMKSIVLFSPEAFSQKGKNGFDYAIKNFSKKNNLQKIVAIINEIHHP